MNKYIFLVIFTFLLVTFGNSQPVNYPLIKGDYYATAQNDTVLFCLNHYGLMIWGVSDVQQPNLLSHLPMLGGDIAYANNNVYVTYSGGNNNVKTIDVSDPYNPILTNNDFGIGYPNKIETKGNLLYLSANGVNFQIYDVSTPTPSLLFQGITSFISDFKIPKHKINVYSDLSVEKGILNFSKDINADLIALSTHGRSGLAHLFRGSVTKNLSKNALKPMLTIKV